VKKFSNGPTKVGDLIGTLLEQKGLKEQVERTGVLAEWADVVGEQISSVTRARAVSGGTLFVEVRSSAWMSELDFMKEEILGKLNKRTEAPIEKLVFLLAGS
jgi:predicted nucleic acid-binding Zn ribbon protein